jgi:hypothetical protein
MGEFCELLEQMKFQKALDDAVEQIPDIEQLVIGWTDKAGMTHWVSVTDGNSDTLWIAECIKYDVMSDKVAENDEG